MRIIREPHLLPKHHNTANKDCASRINGHAPACTCPIYLKSARDLERLGRDTKPWGVPHAYAPLDKLQRWIVPLWDRGWAVTIYNEGTNTVCWHFLKAGTDKAICMAVHVTPVAHLPIKA